MRPFAAAILLSLCLATTAQAESTEPKTPPRLGQGWQWVTMGSNVSQITTGARYSWQHWYGQFNMGGYTAAYGFENNFFIGADAGYRIALHKRWHLRTELGYRHLMPDGSDDPAVMLDHHFSLSGRLLLEVSLNEHIALFVGTGIDRLYTGYSLGSPHHNRGIVSWGVSLL